MGARSLESPPKEGAQAVDRSAALEVRDSIDRLEIARSAKLTKRSDIERVKQGGRAFHSSTFIARVSSSPHSLSRIGVVVPRFGQTAVSRNRLKRRVNAILRTRPLSTVQGRDIVIWARPGAYKLDFRQLDVALEGLRSRIASQG